MNEEDWGLMSINDDWPNVINDGYMDVGVWDDRLLGNGFTGA